MEALKVRQFQKEFMKSSFLPKYEQKIVNIVQKFWESFVPILGETMSP